MTRLEADRMNARGNIVMFYDHLASYMRYGEEYLKIPISSRQGVVTDLLARIDFWTEHYAELIS